MPAPGPLVSIVVPCYNQARFLEEAVDSARQQTHEPVEIIVVDDGSTDETAAVSRGLPGIRYIWQPNGGAAAARNMGLRAGAGEYVVFLDADDRLLPHAVALGLQYLMDHPACGFVTGHVRLVDESGRILGIPPQEHAEDDHYIALLRSNHIWTPGAVLYRRRVLDEVGGFDASAEGSADYDLNIRIARQFPIGCHHQIVLDYRQHGANMTRNAGYMLRSAIEVRRRQRPHVAGDPAARAALTAGIRAVQADFGSRLAEGIKADLREPGSRRRAVEGAWHLLRYYPAGFARLLLQAAGALLRAALASAGRRPG